MLDQQLEATLLYPIVIALFVGSTELDGRFGRKFHRKIVRL